MAADGKGHVKAVTIIDGRRIPYQIIVSPRARRLRVTVTPTGVSVILPEGVRLAEAEQMLQQHSEWVLKQLDHPAGVKQRAATLPKDVLLLRGEVKKVEILAQKGRQGRMQVVEADDRLLLRVPEGRAQEGRALALPWLRGLARAEIEKTARQRAAQMKVNYRSITIRDQKTRWGSCSNRGTLSFNWRLIMAPPQVLDYVVVHELAHLQQPDHSKDFWRLVEHYFPEYKKARAWLRSNAHLLRPDDLT
ncbi:MAG: M48 family metallopeptidase [Anaerolineaceae bacterium]|nr:M48 family metallopeptidase [Anaerolineaceae bacterium]